MPLQPGDWRRDHIDFDHWRFGEKRYVEADRMTWNVDADARRLRREGQIIRRQRICSDGGSSYRRQTYDWKTGIGQGRWREIGAPGAISPSDSQLVEPARKGAAGRIAVADDGT